MAVTSSAAVGGWGALSTGLDARMVGSRSREAPLLTALLLLFYVIYGALGRDVFYNHNDAATAGGDPIGAFLFYARFAMAAAAVLLVTASAGLTWALSKVPLLFAPFVALALASTLWADNWKATFGGAAALAGMWVAVPVLVHRMGLVQAVRASLHLTAVIVILSAALALLVPSIGTHSVAGAAHFGRWRGIFAHKNGLGPWAAYGAVFLLTHAHLCRGPRPYWWFAWACAVACLFFSGSATALGTTVFLVLCSVFFAALRRYRLSVVLTIGGLLFVLAVVAAIPGIPLLFEILGRDETLTGRTDVWAYAQAYFWRRPWFGYGYQSLGGEDFLAQTSYVFNQLVPGPESGYFDLLLEVGLVGAILFAVPFFVVIRNGFEWLKHVELRDRSAIEYMLMIQLSTLIYAATETNALVCTGFDGLIAFVGFFALLTTPKSPDARLRGEFRLAKHYLPPQRRPRSRLASA